ncbi:gamma-glutamyltranspeptidase / glutathione hydrolase [Cohnella sp. OV330]|uniref:gamma-glutamyltransferase n=1 Tax=Cohnella sp. OV330 TaxID=1855288 RepID=UPI0008E9079C|nr:gamma-glutamyltransferase [Cohnella sp. OV330]SFA82716.1 gamma-glutamyltranspeptidase / glutathione hydrolase [Cohnella sp. OV330]
MSRSAVGKRAMVVSPHYLASEAGAEILRRGGNAFDAAVAVSACLGVVYPHMTGLGGDCFWLTYRAGEGRVRAYNGSGRSGGAVDRDCFAGMAAIPHRGARSAITVPGMVDGWAAVQGDYGRLTLAEALEPAIRHASAGFPLSPDQHFFTAKCKDMLAEYAETAAIYLPRGEVPATGDRFVQRELAATLRAVAEGGREAFYEGAIAREIVAALRHAGGLLSEADFAAHRGGWEAPVRGDYRGYALYQAPPNSQGFAGIMALQALERFDPASTPHGSYAYYHRMIEAIKLAFIDRNRELTDPDFHSLPLSRLLSQAYADDLAGRIDPSRALDFDSPPAGSDTAYAAVVDEEGNAVSFIQSLYFEFGSGFTAGKTGVLLQNRGSFFSLDPAHVNSLEPNKRTFHTLMPAMACLDGKPRFLYGTQGGEGQPQTQTAIFTRMADYGMAPHEAVAEPRWLWGRTWGEASRELKLESRIDKETVRRLAEAGHDVRVVDAYDYRMGHAHAISIDGDGIRRGGTDPRCDGAAVGW